jgi:hypothetical protein
MELFSGFACGSYLGCIGWTTHVLSTKVYLEAMFSASAMIMCLSPTIVTLDGTALYFQYWGFFIVFFATLFWACKIYLSNNHRPTD